MGWISPTGFVDPNNNWTDEPLAYDEDTGTHALGPSIGVGAWTSFLELTHSAISCNKVRICATGGPTYSK
ncbi:unnamed protein product, partial [marine sediment metagenome]